YRPGPGDPSLGRRRPERRHARAPVARPGVATDRPAVPSWRCRAPRRRCGPWCLPLGREAASTRVEFRRRDKTFPTIPEPCAPTPTCVPSYSSIPHTLRPLTCPRAGLTLAAERNVGPVSSARTRTQCCVRRRGRGEVQVLGVEPLTRSGLLHQ